MMQKWGNGFGESGRSFAPRCKETFTIMLSNSPKLPRTFAIGYVSRRLPFSTLKKAKQVVLDIIPLFA